jgi:oxidase EvaA
MSSLLRPREDSELSERIARSAELTEGGRVSTEDLDAWLAERRAANTFRVEQVRLDALDGWSFQAVTGNLVHSSGRFFTVEGLHVAVDDDEPRREWYQPIIQQPEIGILGILVKEFDGVLHCLMQAKMEPGNPNLIQLSPTVQATRSNYTRVHGGAPVRHLDYFTGGNHNRVLADVLQSEHGAWFYQKRNRNMIVETDDDVTHDDDFRWVTFGQIAALLCRDNVVNMDSRTVLSCAPMSAFHGDGRDDGFVSALARSRDEGALHPDVELLSWFTEERARHDVRSERVALAGLPGWRHGGSVIEHAEGRYFRVVGVEVGASNREVAAWTQPLIEPSGMGVAAFLARRIGRVLHVLVHAKVEGGFADAVELAPTVQCIPDNYPLTADAPVFLDAVLSADPGQIRYSAVHSEEGGRFLNAESRYMIIEAGAEQFPLEPPPGFCWVTTGQLTSLVRHRHYLNVQARTLLACLNGMVLTAPGNP